MSAPDIPSSVRRFAVSLGRTQQAVLQPVALPAYWRKLIRIVRNSVLSHYDVVEPRLVCAIELMAVSRESILKLRQDIAS